MLGKIIYINLGRKLHLSAEISPSQQGPTPSTIQTGLGKWTECKSSWNKGFHDFVVRLSRRGLRHCSDCRINCRSGCQSHSSPSRPSCSLTLMWPLVEEPLEQLERMDCYEHKDRSSGEWWMIQCWTTVFMICKVLEDPT